MLRPFIPLALAAVLLGPQAAGPSAPAVALDDAARSLDILYAGKRTTAAGVDKTLRAPLRQALNDWAGLAAKHQLAVLVPQKADALVLGRAPEAALVEVARCIERTAEVFDRLAGGAPAGRAVVVALFDEQGFASEAWPALLDALAARRQLSVAFAEQMKAAPGSFTARGASFIAQNTYDQAGDAAAGDDEFRLANEVTHKCAQYLVEARFGRQPDVLRWGFGYVAEQRLFGNAYQFLDSGFVAAASHGDWAGSTRDDLASRAKKDDFTFADAILRGDAAGSPAFGQRCAWALLDYELGKEPARLSELLARLGALDREADPDSTHLEYCGDAARTREACDADWKRIKPAALLEHLERMDRG